MTQFIHFVLMILSYESAISLFLEVVAMLSRQLQYQYPFYKLNESTDAGSIFDSVAMGTLRSTSSSFFFGLTISLWFLSH